MKPQSAENCLSECKRSFFELKPVDSTLFVGYFVLASSKNEENSGITKGRDDNTKHDYHSSHCEENASAFQVRNGSDEACYPKVSYNGLHPGSGYDDSVLKSQ